MANILDYLDWRGDLTLAERGFNEVDNLLMAELCFLDFSGIVPADFSAPVFLPDAMRQYDAARPQETMGVLVPEQIPELGHKMAASRRFSDLTLCAYVSRTDEETQTQFSALTILLPDKTAYIAFRGTDDTIVGWKEDFNLAFLPVVPAQKMAAEYLSAAAAALPSHPLRVGGHSKGGNLAVYSAVFCGEAVQNQLMRVYNNDGPGFRTSLLGLPEHKRVAGRITTILPESSVVGMLLEHEERYEVVRSTQSGLWQHDGFSWQVRGERFEHLPDLTEGGKLVDETIRTFILSLSPEQRVAFTDALFDILTCTAHRSQGRWAQNSGSHAQEIPHAGQAHTPCAGQHAAPVYGGWRKDGSLRTQSREPAPAPSAAAKAGRRSGRTVNQREYGFHAKRACCKNTLQQVLLVPDILQPAVIPPR